MSEWSDSFKQHAIHSVIEAVIGQFETARRSDVERAAENVDALDRLGRILRLVHVTLHLVEGDLVPIAHLDAMVAPLQAIQSELAQYQGGSPPRGHLVNANNQATNLLSQLSVVRTFLLEPRNPDVPSFSEYRDSVQAHLRKIESERATLEAQLANLAAKAQETTSEVSLQKARLDSAIAEFQSQFSAAQQQRRDENAADDRSRLDAFDQMMKHCSDEFRLLQKAQTESIEEKRVELERISAEHLESLRKHLTRAEQLVHVIGNTGMVGGYQAVANTAVRRAKFWSGIAALSLLGLVGFALFAFVRTVDSDVAPAQVASRVLAALCIASLAAYAAKQGAQAESEARSNRQMELELASLEPYLVGIETSDQEKVKLGLVPLLFGNAYRNEASRKAKETTGTARDGVEFMKGQLFEWLKRGPGD